MRYSAFPQQYSSVSDADIIDPRGHVDARTCQNIWVAVLQRLSDDLRCRLQFSSDRDTAERWIGAWPSRDFRTVCDLAGIDPSFAHDHFRKMIAQNQRTRQNTRLNTPQREAVHAA